MEWTPWQRVYREWERRDGKKARQDDWIVRRGGAAYYLPQGPWLKGSSFRRLPTKHPWRKSCAPHNNTTAPGHPHTGNLRSLPPFQGIQTHSCCQPRAPTASSISSGGAKPPTKRTNKRKDNETHIQQTKKNIWFLRKYTAKTMRFPRVSLTQFTNVHGSWMPGRFC